MFLLKPTITVDIDPSVAAGKLEEETSLQGASCAPLGEYSALWYVAAELL